MFDLITGHAQHAPHQPARAIALSVGAHACVLTLLVALPLLYVTNQLPEIPAMMAFVAAPPPPSPPPPPPPAVPRPVASPTTRPVPTVEQVVAPIAAPAPLDSNEGAPFDEGEALWGVEGGVPGGVPGGIVSGLFVEAPPPPPPPSGPRAPVRIGGLIQQPALVRRVEPEYPQLAVNARITGLVILEAVVAEDGHVESARVLRSLGVLLDRAALEAVREWRYSPLTLNGLPARFVLTVTVNFSLPPVGQ